jgi:hypothetical protein
VAERREKPVLLQKARVRSGDYGSWRVGPEHDGTEIWIIAEPPRRRRFRHARGGVGEGLSYRRVDGLVARAEYLELVPEFRVMEAASRALH